MIKAGKGRRVRLRGRELVLGKVTISSEGKNTKKESDWARTIEERPFFI